MNHTRQILLSCSLFCLGAAAVPPARAWDDTGHQIIAAIAYQRLKPGVRTIVDVWAKQVHATKKGKPMSYNAITLANWMDDFKHPKKGVSIKGDWHFVLFDMPRKGTVPAIPDSSGDHKNAIWALNTYIPKLGDKTASEPQPQILGYVLHIVGDIHQPLHAVGKLERGHQFPIQGVPDLKSDEDHLHEFWDEAYRFTGRNGKVVALFPLKTLKKRDAAKAALVSRLAAGITKRYPESRLPEVGRGGAEQWARESNAIAGDVFPDSLGHRLTAAYATKAHAIAERRMALAGYRLAHVLNTRLSGVAAE